MCACEGQQDLHLVQIQTLFGFRFVVGKMLFFICLKSGARDYFNPSFVQILATEVGKGKNNNDNNDDDSESRMNACNGKAQEKFVITSFLNTHTHTHSINACFKLSPRYGSPSLALALSLSQTDYDYSTYYYYYYYCTLIPSSQYASHMYTWLYIFNAKKTDFWKQ